MARSSDTAMSKRKRAIHDETNSPVTFSSPASNHDEAPPSAKRKRKLTYGQKRSLSNLGAPSTPIKSTEPAEFEQTISSSKAGTSGKLRELLSSQKKQKQDTPSNEIPETPPSIDRNPFAVPSKKDRRKRKSSLGQSDGVVGHFLPDEIEALEAFKFEFSNSHGLLADVFDKMVQHSSRDKGVPFPHEDTVIAKVDFWRQIYQILPTRDKRSVYRFMRRHFRDSDQKPHEWTEGQDNELKMLHLQYGARWALIAKQLGRTDDDVVQRWKNKLEHRDTMNIGAWTDEEIRQLQNALQVVYNRMKVEGEDVGEDIYEMNEKKISWGTISNSMDNCRSRQQCADKWRKLRRQKWDLDNGRARRRSNPPKTKPTTSKKPKTPKNTTPNAKSSEYVNSDSSDDDEPSTDNKIEPRESPSRSQTSLMDMEYIQDEDPKEKPKGAFGLEIASSQLNEQPVQKIDAVKSKTSSKTTVKTPKADSDTGTDDKASSDKGSISSASSDEESGDNGEDDDQSKDTSHEEQVNTIEQTPILPKSEGSEDETRDESESDGESNATGHRDGENKESDDEEMDHNNSSDKSTSDDDDDNINKKDVQHEDNTPTIQQTPVIPKSQDPSDDASTEDNSDDDDDGGGDSSSSGSGSGSGSGSDSDSDSDSDSEDQKIKTNSKAKESPARVNAHPPRSIPSFLSNMGAAMGISSLNGLKEKYMSPSRRQTPPPPPPVSTNQRTSVNLNGDDSDSSSSSSSSDDDSDTNENSKPQTKKPVQNTSKVNGPDVANRQILNIGEEIFSDSDDSSDNS
ncbi:RNA polymerase I enhancer binding protein [Aspergillus nanangensis]|uniref:RNA polymerase I enhancer binding protein n=1 Tax=Aspergillus nanangensis TaxID=2582783 RepID=A0AAD4CS43_ASPNN|nr:RNA polymerase I enhancer binding protein [Aspergillus nanangensis]